VNDRAAALSQNQTVFGGDEAIDLTVAETDAAEEDASGKADGAFRSISEAAAELDLPPHVLRYWETRFPALRPVKRAGGRRYYRPSDIEFLQTLRKLLHEDGYTIRGAQRLLRQHVLGEEADTEEVAAELRAAEISAERASPHDLQAAILQAAQAGSFGPVEDLERSPAVALDAEDERRRRLDAALQRMSAAKARLDAVRASR
jgi:DNA-binding transcriptional MerR regulator